VRRGAATAGELANGVVVESRGDTAPAGALPSRAGGALVHHPKRDPSRSPRSEGFSLLGRSGGMCARPSRRRPLAIARRPQAHPRRSQPPGRTRAALAARSHGGRLPRPVVKAPIPTRAVGRFGQLRRRRTMPDWVGAATATAASGWLSSAAGARLKGDGGYLARAPRSASMQWNALHTSRICDAIFPLDPA
jgi:hypothetical protein